jgi:plastocyanin
LAPRYPNEWEFFLRNLVLSEEAGAPLDLGGEVAYNLAAEGVDGEVSVGKRLGSLSATVAARALANPYVSGDVRFALAGGLVIRLTHHLALAGDVGSIFNRDSARGEKAAWSVGLHIAIPNTPHTFSLQATNTNTATLQGASRGGSQKRYGFEFTIPFTLARYFGGRPKPATPAAVPAVALPDAGGQAAAPSGATTTATIHGFAFTPGTIEIAAGGTVTWKNGDEIAHTVTSADGSFTSPLIEPGTSWSYTFTKPGTFTYSCTPHPFMKGSVEVK